MDTTDPAKEIATALRRFAALPASEQNLPTWACIQKVAGGIPEDDLLELCTVMIQRITRLRDFTTKVQDIELDEQVREAVIRSLDAAVMAFRPAQLAQAWLQTHGAFQAQNSNNLMAFVPIVRRHQPLLVLSEGQRKELLTKIDDAGAQLDQDSDLPDWMRSPLRDGLRRLQLVLQYFPFFGHEAAIESILQIHQRAAAADQEIARTSTIHVKKPRSIGELLNLAMFAVNVFCAADRMVGSYLTYQGWLAQAQIRVTESLIHHPKMLLPPPGDRPSNYNDEPSAIEPRKPVEGEDEKKPEASGQGASGSTKP